MDLQIYEFVERFYLKKNLAIKIQRNSSRNVLAERINWGENYLHLQSVVDERRDM